MIHNTDSAGWAPITTAPTDGSHVLLYRPNICFVGYFATAAGRWVHNAPGLPDIHPPPTDWRPLPPHPTLKEGQPLIHNTMITYTDGEAVTHEFTVCGHYDRDGYAIMDAIVDAVYIDGEDITALLAEDVLSDITDKWRQTIN